MKLSAYAKINWSLAITGRRADGYHLLDTLMQTISLHDTLDISPADTLSLAVDGPCAVAAEDNLVIRAATLLRARCHIPQGAAMRLTKHIPSGAGLGGGSADAAAALRGLCALWSVSPPEALLAEIALTVGADVPYFLHGGLARIGGIGEAVCVLPAPPVYQLVILRAAEGLSTPDVYRRYDRLPAGTSPDMDSVQRALSGGSTRAIADVLGNDLQAAAMQLRPGIADGLHALLENGARCALMTGSGSAVFGLFDSKKEATRAAQACAAQWPLSFAVHTV